MFKPQSAALDEGARVSPGQERRVWVRCSCNLDSSCQPIPLSSASQPEMQWHAKVRDLSGGGLKLLLRRRFEPGTALFIDIPTAEEKAIITLGAVVVYVSLGPEGWTHGCRFAVHLTQDEMAGLL